jgi:hypothetical protein
MHESIHPAFASQVLAKLATRQKMDIFSSKTVSKKRKRKGKGKGKGKHGGHLSAYMQLSVALFPGEEN